MKRPNETRPTAISVLALPEMTPATPYGMLEVLAAVGVTWAQLTGEACDGPPMEPRIVSATGRPIATELGVPLVPHASLAEAGEPDIVIVSDLQISNQVPPTGRWRREAAWLRQQYERGATVCSVCTGSLFLAETGLLDGLEATTHWSAVRLFAEHYPAVRLRPERVLCPAGDGHRLVTSGGAASWEDLALYLVARFCSPAEAVRLAKIFVLGDRSEGQLPYAAMTARRHDDAVIGRCQAWIAEHYDGPNPVARMVQQSGLAERTFKRRFRAATGYAPVDYVQTLRIEEAKQLLETTELAVDAIARQVGYEDPASFRRLFKRRTGVTSARYRQKFQSIATAARAGERQRQANTMMRPNR